MATALTRLALTKRLGQWSGTKAPSEITSTTSPDDDHVRDLVSYIDQAWIDIQISQNSRWDWMQNQSVDVKALTASNRIFTMASLDATARTIIPFTVHDTYPLRYVLLKHPTTAAIRKIKFIPYQFFRGYLDRGTRPEQAPTLFTIRKNGDLEFDPTPKVAFTINCDFVQIPTELTADGSTPDMPIHFHQLVVWYAIVHLMDFDENANRYQTADRQYKRMINRLHIEQLPEDTHDEYMSTNEIYGW